MVFSSSTFLFLFLPLVLLVHSLLGSTKWRNLTLLLFSLLFYYWGEGLGVLLMVWTIGINYMIGLLMEGREDQRKKWVLGFGVGLNLLGLGFFKYANFFIDNLNIFLDWTGLPEVVMEPVHLPIGISFFTFQAITYIVDIYRGDASVQRNPFNLALYISLFPQLIAGPIVRYNEIQQQLSRRLLGLQQFTEGIRRFIIGLAKKVLIADRLGYVADQVFAQETSVLQIDAAWLGLICYAFQIYFDFSGYSDMAIGIGRMLGFNFPENFRYPYTARSIREFWRRWHITLSTWFRDYLYIPLGGNRKGTSRTIFHLILVFFLCGLWHGASWNFVIWGLFHGLFLGLERTKWGEWLERLPIILRHTYVLLVVLVSWVFFRAETLDQALQYLGALFGLGMEGAHFTSTLFLNREILAVLIMATLFSTPVYLKIVNRVQALQERKLLFGEIIKWIALFALFLFSVASILSSAYSPFIYFRF